MKLYFSPSSNGTDAAAVAMWKGSSKVVPYSSCRRAVNYMEHTFLELPMGLSEKETKKLLYRKTYRYCKEYGYVPAGLVFKWLLPILASTVFKKMLELAIDNFLNNDGEWLCPTPSTA